MTPNELNERIEVYAENKKQEFKDNLTYAYYTAAFTAKAQSKKGLAVGDLKDILEKIDRDKEPMSDDQIYNVILGLHKQFGGG